MGPVSLAGLKEDKYVRVTTGKLPEADFVFADEVFKASSAILNTLLRLLNERVFDRGDGTLATVVGLVTFFLGSTGAFLELQTALNAIWRVKPKPNAGIREMLFQRLLSFGLVVGVTGCFIGLTAGEGSEGVGRAGCART